MENLDKLTPTELLVLINKTKTSHDLIKEQIINYTFEVEKLENLINDKIVELKKFEDDYLKLIEEMENRKNG